MGRKHNDLTGKRFGRLTAIERAGTTKDRHATWLCKCDCGNVVIVCSRDMTTGHTKSCGCLNREQTAAINATHLKSGERLYRVWLKMRERCNTTSNKNFKHYGGRGIKICEEWNDYTVFRTWALDNGYDKNAPFGKCTLDRINNNGNYEPLNCRWVDMKIQANNKRNSKKKPFRLLFLIL